MHGLDIHGNTNGTIEENENIIKEMKLQIQEKDKIINEERRKYLDLKIKNSELNEEIDQLKSYILSQDKNLIYLKIVSIDQKINFSIFCKR